MGQSGKNLTTFEKVTTAINFLLWLIARIWLIIVLIIGLYLLWEGLILGSTDGTLIIRIVGIRYLIYGE